MERSTMAGLLLWFSQSQPMVLDKLAREGAPSPCRGDRTGVRATAGACCGAAVIRVSCGLGSSGHAAEGEGAAYKVEGELGCWHGWMMGWRREILRRLGFRVN